MAEKTTGKPTPHGKKVKLKKRKLTAALVVFLTFYIVLMLISTIFFILFLHSTKPSEQALSLTVLYDDDDKTKYSQESVFINGALYIPYAELDKIGDFIITGDSHRITIISGTSDDYCTLYDDSLFMYVGNVPFRLTSPVIFGDSDYYIPIEIVENYMLGVTVEYDLKKSVCTVSCTDPDAITFIGKYQVAPNKLPETDIPVRDTSDVSESF
ncbi:MAG TPA: hypothetical protein PLT66_03955 [Bacillota bacterium]|nr:hypothetical protein [Bacillota bacterium]